MSRILTSQQYIVSIADRIIMLLHRRGEMRARALVKAIDEEAEIVRFVLQFLLKFDFIEHNSYREVMRLSKAFRHRNWSKIEISDKNLSPHTLAKSEKFECKI